MIVSHKYKFIFIAIPKTATHAIRFALRPHLGSDDWEQVELFHKSKLPFKAFENVNHGHITAIEAKRALGEEVWNTYFKFTFVRNPLDRFISYAFFKHQSSDFFSENKLAVMKLIFKKPWIEKDILFKPQSDFIVDKLGENMMDYVGQYEHLQADFDRVCRTIGLPEIGLDWHNSSGRKGKKSPLDEELIGLISNYYKVDIERFKYSLFR